MPDKEQILSSEAGFQTDFTPFVDHSDPVVLYTNEDFEALVASLTIDGETNEEGVLGISPEERERLRMRHLADAVVERSGMPLLSDFYERAGRPLPTTDLDKLGMVFAARLANAQRFRELIEGEVSKATGIAEDLLSTMVDGYDEDFFTGHRDDIEFINRSIPLPKTPVVKAKFTR